jgi:hypothetical protein
MQNTRIKLSNVIKNQLPNFVKENYPLVESLFNEYYSGIEYQGGTLDILQNIDKYVKLDNLTNLIETTSLSQDISFSNTSIPVSTTAGFPDKYGLIQIDNEIILYKSKTSNSFEECSRGFSGITSYENGLEFQESSASQHSRSSVVKNLNILFLNEFFKKIKYQFAPGFEDRKFFSGTNIKVNKNLLIKQLKDFYTSKGTDASYKILFKALFGDDVQVIKPRDYLIRPSDAQYRKNQELVVEAIEGDPKELVNTTIFQNALTIDGKDFISSAYGTVNKVQTISRKDKTYYVLSLDFDYNKDINLRGSVYGNFVIGPKTRIIDEVLTGSTSISVDSTYGFPEKNGTLVVYYDDNTSQSINYERKNLNQFLGCSGIVRTIQRASDIYLDYVCEGGLTIGQDENPIKFRISGVLSEAIVDPKSHYIVSGNRIKLRTLGKDIKDSKFNNWKLNACPSYDVKSIEINNPENNIYTINLYDDHIFYQGDEVTLQSTFGLLQSFNGVIESVSNNFKVNVSLPPNFNPSSTYKIERKVAKFQFTYNSEVFPESDNIYIADVQNTYKDSEENLYVSSQSLPKYSKERISLSDETVVLGEDFFIGESVNVNNPSIIDKVLNIGKHSFITGDAVYYQSGPDGNSLNILDGVYYVKVLGSFNNSTQIKLSSSRSNIDNNIFVDVGLGKDTLELSGTENKIYKSTNELIFFQNNLSSGEETEFSRKISPKNIFKKISKPIIPNDEVITPSGPIGILANGVEIQNYKSNDFIYYGAIKSIDVKSFGSGYDVINPPILEITDDSGIGATAISHVRGSLDRIDILDGGFDYDGIPEIKISGGNGSNALAIPNMTVFEHFVEFVAESNQVNVSTNTITFNLKHKFYEGERIRYDYTDVPIEGLQRNVDYFVSPDTDFVLKIYGTFSDAIHKTNPIDLTSLAPGKHYLKSVNKKSTIGSIRVIRSGKNYTNKKWVFNNDHLDLYRNSIKINNHGYKTGEIIVYNANGTSISGLTTNTEYFVSVLDEDEFRLCGINTDQVNPKDYNLTKNVFVNFVDYGSGSYNINYQEIKVEILGNFKNKSLPAAEIGATIIPYFKGELFSTAIVNSGSGYGSESVLNFNRQPKIQVKNGSGAELKPIISNGQIKRVLIVNGGSNYNTTPTIEIDGAGTGANLIPVISNGRIIDVKVTSEGINYNNNGTSLRVISSGSGAGFDFSIQTWNINSVERLILKNLITSNDIILYDTKNEFGERITQITHSYAPRKLRENILVSKVEGDKIFYKKDLEVDSNGVESITSDIHSPIIGWAYDGNPIYGPFGFTNANGSGLFKRMESGYSRLLSENRPSTDIFPLGIFVEDYQYTDIGDLDEYNGRFCVTPEFPNGVYAYFSTIGGFDSQFSQKYLRPEFPYLIGNKFKSSIIDFNFETTINQNSVSFESLNLIRNTNQYKFLSDTATYNYVFNPIDYEEQLNKVSRTERGIIDDVTVISGGENYTVGDKIEFDEDEFGNRSFAEVSEIKGKTVNSISVNNTTIENIEFGTSTFTNSVLGVSSEPHGLSDNDIISIIGLDELLTNDRKEVSSSVNVFTNQLTLNQSIAIGTSADNFIPINLKVIGNLKPTTIRPNDVYSIGYEELKVLNIYPQDSEIRVLRNKSGISSHPVGATLIEKPRVFEVSAVGDVSSEVFLGQKNYPINNEIYFDPSISVGIGTTGFTSTVLLETTPVNYQVGISTDSYVYGDLNAKLSLVFNNQINSSNFRIGEYVKLIGSSDPSFDFEQLKVLNVGFSSITVDYNTINLTLTQLNSIAGSGVTSFVQKWITREIPIRQIYLPEHKLKTGDKIVYNNNSGSQIIASENKLTTFPLTDPENLYAYVFDSNHIGISTDYVGLTTTGEYLNPTNNATLLYFTNVGSRKYHSFKTDYNDVQVGKISKNIARVTTSTNPSLFYNEKVNITVKDTSVREIIVKYNDENRRLVFDPKDFVQTDTDNNTIIINNHGYYTGEKVIHTTEVTDPLSPIKNNKIYYVVVKDDNNFSLAETYNDAISKNPNVIDLITSSDGKISSINPSFNLYRNQIVDFILTDQSLSFVNNDTRFSAFDFDLYTDEKFIEKFIKSENDTSFKVTKIGEIGVENFAKVRLEINDHTPQKLFYKFTLVNTSLNVPETKTQYRIDDDNIPNNSTLFILDSAYSGEKRVYSAGSNYFDYFLRKRPEKTSYTKSNSNISYVTDSYSTTGTIEKVSVLSRDRKYRVLPGITSITTETGSGALLFPFSEKIGSVKKVDIQNIGFDYSVDYSLRPTGNLPQLINVEPLSIFKNIKVLSIGKNYTLTPDLIVLDGLTNKFDSQSELKFIPEDYQVEIIQNSSGLFNKTPIIVPINNSNGISVRSASYNIDEKILTFTLNPFFSSKADVPFDDGDKVLLENFRVNDVVVDPITNEVSVNQNVKGINSENYGYALFTVENVTSTSFSIDMSNYLIGEQIPGNYIPVNSFGYVVPQSYFPTFEITLQKNNFVIGEEVVTTSGFTGIVEYWDRENEFVSVLSDNKFVRGDRITGKTSNLTGVVGKVEFFDAEYKTSSSSTVARGWDTEIGFLNDKSQRIQDSFYYQYFSYDLKSKTQYSDWEDAVSSLNHVSGFRKFSTFEVESSTETANPITISYSELNSVSDLISIIDLNSYVNFDMVSENSYLLDGRVVSDQIVFNTIPVQDYAESVGNRVLMIDDFSREFNNLPREERFVVADRFPIFQTRFRKYFTYVKDKLFFNERQFGIITIIHDNLEGYVSQYGRLDTVNELGNFEFKIKGNFGEITFNPFDYEFNDFDVELVSYSLFDTFAGLGSTAQQYYDLGNIVKFNNQTSEIPSGSTSTIGISTVDTTYRSSKVLVTLNDETGEFRESVELNIVHDGTDVYISEYGKLYTQSINPPVGFATYSAFISGSNIVVTATPTVAYASTLEVNVFNISIADLTRSSPGVLALANTRLESGFVNIPITQNPVPIQIHQHTLVYGGSYYYLSISDTTNGIYNALELTTVNNETDVYETQFGSVITDDSLVKLGTITTQVVGNTCRLFFTPLSGRNLDIRYYYQGVKTTTEVPENPDELILSLNESQINSYTTDYIGTQNAIRRSFELYHKNLRILRRVFNASSFTSVNLVNDTIRIPNHYFVTGEEVVYDTNGDDPIGIAVTDIPGIGSTNILPSKLYIIKENDLFVRVAASASQALRAVPDYLNLTSYGTGTNHTFTGKKGNPRSLITIDNMIQQPIVSTSFETRLSEPVGLKDIRVKVENPEVFIGGDIFQVDNEILRVKVVGFGATNTLLVNRFWLGTLPGIHTVGTACTKLVGDYNIVDNTIHFYDPPYGPIPITPTNPKPDEVDFVGIATGSSFSGRIFNKSGQINGDNPTYSDNILLDGISEQFTGIRSEFTLTEKGVPASGISTSNLFVLVKNILQVPFDEENNPDGAFTLGQLPGGEATIIFKQSEEVANTDDINSTNLPVGGVIVSTGSTFGSGYQPLNAAGASVTIANNGSISNVTIGSTGSGYRLVGGKEILVTTSSGISSGSNVLTINEERGLFDKLAYSSSPLCSVGVGTIYNDVQITGYNQISSTITLAENLDVNLPSGSQVSIKLNDLSTELVDIGIRTESKSDYNVAYLGFSTVINGSISSNLNLVNPGIAFTAFYDVFATRASQSVSVGSTVVYINTIRNINNINNYITLNSNYNVKITGIGNTFITVDTPLSAITANDVITIRRYSPPEIVFDSPLAYSDIPLIYSSDSPSVGIGTGAKLNLVIGVDGSVVDFNFTNNGYGYRPFEVLTVPVGGLTGIPTNTSQAFSEFQIFVDDVYDTKFSSWSIGDLQVIDNFDNLFDNTRQIFPIKINGETKSLRAKKGSSIDIQATLIVLFNDILQVPGEGYTFKGGSIIYFPEPPKFGDTVTIIFYRGNGDVDVLDVDILDPLEVGDSLTIVSDVKRLNQNERIVSEIVSSDYANTLIYSEKGIANDFNLLRPVILSKKTEDSVIDGQFVGKNRVYYESNIYPAAKLISNITENSSEFYIDSLKPFFDNAAETIFDKDRNKIKIIDQTEKSPAIATCQVSNGQVTSISILDGGQGYVTAPNISIQYPYFSHPAPIGIALTNINDLVGTISSTGISTAIIGEFISGEDSGASGILAGIVTGNYIKIIPTNLNRFQVGEEINLFESGFSADISSLDSTEFATATSTISSGSVNLITVTNPGTGYTYGPIKTLELISNGSGYPATLNESNSTFTSARLKSKTGIGRNAAVDINLIVDLISEDFVVDRNNINITSKGLKYSVGDILEVDVFDNPGIGETFRNYPLTTPFRFEVKQIEPPKVSIDPPTVKTEIIPDVSFLSGDFGVIVGISTISRVVVGSIDPPAVVFDLYIPENSILRDADFIGNTVVGSAITISQLNQGDYFAVNNSTIANIPNTSYGIGGQVIGISTNLNNIYQVLYTPTTSQITHPKYGQIFVRKVVCPIQNLSSDFDGVFTDSDLAEFSWGKISNLTKRTDPTQFNVDLTSNHNHPIIQRYNPLKYENFDYSP